MVWRRYPYNSIWNGIEDMRAELDALFQLGPYRGRLLRIGEEPSRSHVNAKVRKRKNLKVIMCRRGYLDRCKGLLPYPQM